jgi:energy-coupling factor transporter ATP-binding protein EcfA2
VEEERAGRQVERVSSYEKADLMNSVEFDNVTFSYVGSKKPALKDINLKIPKGQSVLIAGPNAAGKTSLCRCMNGLVPHFFIGDLDGRVIINGINSKQSGIGQLSQLAGLVFDDPTSQLVCSSVRDEAAFGAENLGVSREEIDRRVAEALEAVRLRGYEKRIPQTLSGGEQQAIAIASIMVMDPEIFVLDEPTSNLDPIGSMQVLSIISDLARKQEKTMIVVSHSIEHFVDLADRIIVMSEGRVILDDTPKEVLQKTEQLLNMGLSPPEVTTLFSRLRSEGINLAGGKIPVKLEEAYDALKKVSATRVSEAKPKSSSSGKPGGVVIAVKGVAFRYPGSDVLALNGINVEITKNEFIAIIGQNGSGKSTLVKHLNGLLRPTEGTVSVYGLETANTPVWDLSKRVGYVFQNPDLQLFNTTVRNEIDFSLKAIGFPPEKRGDVVNSVAKRLNIEQYLDISPGTLDKGGRQRVAIASVLAMNPDVFVIDEPTTGQDPANSRQVMNIARDLHSEGKTIVFITHNMEIVAEYAQRGIIMSHGRVLYDGPVRQLFQQTGVLNESFLEAPQMVRLAQMLRGQGFPSTLLTVEEMADFIKQNVG